MSMNALTPFLEAHYLESLGLLPVLLFLALLAFLVHIDSYIHPGLRNTMRLIIAMLFSLVAQNYLEYRLAAGELRWLPRTLASIYGYTVRPVILVLFLKLIEPRKRFNASWALVIVNAAVYATALFSHLAFWIDDENHYEGGPLSAFCLFISLILIVLWIILAARLFHPQKRKETWVPLLVLAMILGATALDYNVGPIAQPISFLTIAAVIGCTACYIWLHLQFVREHEQALQAEQRIQIMMTQIQPHFLYNTIATIRALCRRDADRAGEVAEKFGDYLRQNLDSLSIVGLIPFEKELEHTRIYAEIEMVRFDNIRVAYDIQDDAFELPPLTIQPLVENAIRHGVRIREEGLVRVATWRGDGCHEIVVSDNGVGFDMEKAWSGDGSHIGIRNVQERIERMCGGAMKVESRIGEGTTVTIAIPVRETRSEGKA